MYLGSDAMALAQLTTKLIYLEEGDWAVLTPTSYQVYDQNDNKVTRDITILTGGPTRHYDLNRRSRYGGKRQLPSFHAQRDV